MWWIIFLVAVFVGLTLLQMQRQKSANDEPIRVRLAGDEATVAALLNSEIEALKLSPDEEWQTDRLPWTREYMYINHKGGLFGVKAEARPGEGVVTFIPMAWRQETFIGIPLGPKMQHGADIFRKLRKRLEAE